MPSGYRNPGMKLIVICLLLCGLVDANALAIGSSLPSFSLAGLGQFIASIKSLFGSGADFAQKFGYKYGDIYNDQLMRQAVKTFTNDKQKEEAVKQEQLLQKDVAAEGVYFTVICTFAGLSFTLLSVLVCIKLREQSWSLNSRAKQKIIEQYKRDIELKNIAARAQGVDEV